MEFDINECTEKIPNNGRELLEKEQEEILNDPVFAEAIRMEKGRWIR